MIDVAGEKYVVIQELGMYSGNTTLNSSQETQRKFFEVFFKEMKNEPQLRAAFNFQLVDWSPEVTAIFSEELVNEGASEEFVNQFAESLTTMGLIHYTDGSRKKAWNEFLFWLESFEE